MSVCLLYVVSSVPGMPVHICAYTANEGTVRIQYKGLAPIYVFPEVKLFIYFQDRSAYSAAGKYLDRSWEYINRSQTHECGNWD
jgi:hypothetical protein